MDKTTLALIAAVGAFSAAPALASTNGDVTERILRPQSVAELLEPIGNPVETLATLDASRQLEGVEVADAELHLGPLGIGIGHHHHHHHRYYRRYHHHHHHHHHHFRHHHHHYRNY